MGFLDRLKEFISNNKYSVGIAGVAGVTALGYFIYLVANDEEMLGEAPSLLKETSAQERALEALKKSFDRKNPQEIKKLASLLQVTIEEATKKNQQEFKNARLQAKAKGFRQYFDAISEGMNQLTTEISKVQNEIFGEFGMSEEQFEQICSQNPSILAEMYQNSAQQSEGKPYTLQEMKELVKQQRQFLVDPNLIGNLKEVMKGLPQEAYMQLPVYISIMMTDSVSGEKQFDEMNFNKSLSLYIMDLQKDLQEQQMIMQRIITQLMGAGGGPGYGQGYGQGMGGGLPNEMGSKAQIASMLGLDPEALDQEMMSGDNEMLRYMMESLGGGGFK